MGRKDPIQGEEMVSPSPDSVLASLDPMARVTGRLAQEGCVFQEREGPGTVYFPSDSTPRAPQDPE